VINHSIVKIISRYCFKHGSRKMGTRHISFRGLDFKVKCCLLGECDYKPPRAIVLRRRGASWASQTDPKLRALDAKRSEFAADPICNFLGTEPFGDKALDPRQSPRREHRTMAL
jgi:hypothetical protein